MRAEKLLEYIDCLDNGFRLVKNGKTVNEVIMTKNENGLRICFDASNTEDRKPFGLFDEVYSILNDNRGAEVTSWITSDSNILQINEEKLTIELI